jgi:CheY-like chemotaxis protein
MSGRYRVLHVDDEGSLLDLVAHVVGEADGRVEVTGVDDPDRALSALDEYDCVVTDSLVTADGEPFAVAARRHAATLPILLFSAQEWPALADLARRTGAAGYVQKDGTVGLAALASRVSRLADGVPSDLAAVPTGPAEVRDASALSTLGVDSDAGWRVTGHHDFSNGELSVSLTEALVPVFGGDVDGLPPLYETVDPEPLEAFLAHSADARVTFTYLGWEVAIDGTGTVAVRAVD